MWPSQWPSVAKDQAPFSNVGNANGQTNKWLKDQGLLSVKKLWVHIRYPATAR